MTKKLILIEGRDGEIYRGVSPAWPEAIYDAKSKSWREIPVRMRPDGWGRQIDALPAD
jgi:hypothetical protein